VVGSGWQWLALVGRIGRNQVTPESFLYKGQFSLIGNQVVFSKKALRHSFISLENMFAISPSPLSGSISGGLNLDDGIFGASEPGMVFK
jgi:hypothetical protein